MCYILDYYNKYIAWLTGKLMGPGKKTEKNNLLKKYCWQKYFNIKTFNIWKIWLL